MARQGAAGRGTARQGEARQAKGKSYETVKRKNQSAH